MPPSIFVVALILFILMLFYFILLRPWQLRWGATDDEIKRSMPEGVAEFNFY